MRSIRMQALVAEELALASALVRGGDLVRAMRHLERAHVVGQRSVRLHVLVHWWMFRIAVARRDPGAALGQIARMVLGAVGSAVGVLPIGNTGGSDVSMFRTMPIPPELARQMERGDHE